MSFLSGGLVLGKLLTSASFDGFIFGIALTMLVSGFVVNVASAPFVGGVGREGDLCVHMNPLLVIPLITHT